MIYLDHAATTRVYPQVIKEMEPYFYEKFANPSGAYDISSENKEVIQKTREKIAQALNAKPNEIFFTSGGSESDNWAVKGIAIANREKGRHIITTKIEHHAVLYSCKYLERYGYEITYLDVDSQGRVRIEDVEAAIREDTILISVMAANNEIGTLQPIEAIGWLAKKHGILFHTDAVQMFCQLPLDVGKGEIDLLSASAHKFGGPKGIGFLYIKEGTKIEPYIHGGGQENKMRAGTENVPYIVGMGKAVEISRKKLYATLNREQYLRDYMIHRVMEEIPGVKLNGPFRNRLPGNVNFCFENLSGASLLILLNEREIYASAGSACNADSSEPSHVLQALGVPENYIEGAIRFTFGEENTRQEVDEVVNLLKKSVKELRDSEQ